jgi:hypothetical protein
MTTRISTLEDIELKQIEDNIIKKIMDQYLTEYEQDFVYLILKGRRTLECSQLLKTPACEIVRKRKVLTRKLRAIYTYHFKYDPIFFLKYAVDKLDPIKFKCLILHVFELSTLKNISKVLGVMPSTIQRWLAYSKSVLEKNCSDPYIKRYLGCFVDLPYLKIEKVNRPKKEFKILRETQIGDKTLGEWLEDKVG